MGAAQAEAACYAWFVRRAVPLLVILLVTAGAWAQARLRTGGDRANFGVLAHTGESDEQSLPIVSGGNYDVRALDAAPSCRGNVMLMPDAIVRLRNPPASLRFSVRAAGDTTLVVHTPDGRWRCDDDSGSNRNPALLLEHPLEGQYDVWVGSYRPEQNHRARLFVE